MSGTAERPRLNVFRSLNHIYAQLIDDVRGHTVVAASTLDKEVADALGIGVRTVETHRASILRKHGIESLAGLVRYAIRKGIIEA